MHPTLFGRLFRALIPILSIALAAAQPPVRPENIGERALVVTPLEGSGTFFDPKRPAFLPQGRTALPEGILSIRTVESDDGRFALVEVVARDRATLDAVLAPVAGRTDVKRYRAAGQSGRIRDWSSLLLGDKVRARLCHRPSQNTGVP
ncbi:MAG: hypothetical protein R2729_29315 [Bryobacteraceae bacterium]